MKITFNSYWTSKQAGRPYFQCI